MRISREQPTAPSGRPSTAGRRRRALWLLAGVGAIALLAFVLWVGPWVFTRHPSSGLTDAEVLTAQNDVRTTLVQTVAGLAVAAGAYLTYRTFRQNQLDQSTRHDREERTYRLNQSQQVTDTYTKAVEQLGHAQAPVRLGALHSLVSLAQAEPARRQTVVDVLCAYLRMPYEPASSEGPRSPAAVHAAQELQVRLTVQRLLADHLRRPEDTLETDFQDLAATPEQRFWPGVRLDLTGATLVDLDFRTVSVASAGFRRARFTGTTVFDRTAFAGPASFDGATFTGDASFESTAFADTAWFADATFDGSPDFSFASFADESCFDRATFDGAVSFERAGFAGTVSLRPAVFAGSVSLHRATFRGAAWFTGTTFARTASFTMTEFVGDADFDETTFGGRADFSEAHFSGGASFSDATVSGEISFEEASFSLDDPDDPDDPDDLAALGIRVDDNGHRELIAGWVVRPDDDDPTRGTLVRGTFTRRQPSRADDEPMDDAP